MPDNAETLPEVDAAAIPDALDRIAFDGHVHRAVVGEDAVVAMRAVDVVDIVVPDHRSRIVGRDIDGARIDQGAHRPFPKGLRLAYLVLFNNTGCSVDVLLRIIDAQTEGGMGEVLDIVPDHVIIDAAAADERLVRHHPAVSDETVSGDDGVPAHLVDVHAAVVVPGEQAVLQQETVRPVHLDADGTQVTEAAVPDGQGIGPDPVQPDKILPGGVAEKRDPFHLEPCQTGVAQREKRRYRAGMQAFPFGFVAEDIARQAASVTKFRQDGRPCIRFFPEIQPAVLDPDHGIERSHKPLGNMQPQVLRLLFGQVRFLAADLVDALIEKDGNRPAAGLPDRRPGIFPFQGIQIDIIVSQVITASIVLRHQRTVVAGNGDPGPRQLQPTQVQMPFAVEIDAGADVNLHPFRHFPSVQDTVQTGGKGVEIGLGRDAQNDGKEGRYEKMEHGTMLCVNSVRSALPSSPLLVSLPGHIRRRNRKDKSRGRSRGCSGSRKSMKWSWHPEGCSSHWPG